MCCEAEWKREVVHDHKWDFINVSEFHRTDLFTRLKYVFRYILLFKSIAVMGLDIFTAITMISSDHWTNTLTQKASADSSSGINVQFAIAKWVFVGCIIFSFLLYGYEFYKAKHVVQSRDIAYAFTNLQANDYFSFKNYDNFCLFCHIENSTKRKDDLAFFVFFTFKDWKRLLLADGPRQSINALLLYSFGTANGWQTSDIPAWWDKDLVTAMLLFSMIATVLIFAGSLILLIAASVMYVPLLCYIQGNLKEYVCVKVDKRLAELIRKKQRQRAARAAALEKKLAKDGGLRNSKGELVNVTLQPTLPKIKLDEDEMSLKGMRGDTSRLGGMGLPRSGSRDALGAFGNNTSAITLNQGADEYAYPPTLDYSSNHLYAAGAVADHEYGSTTRLTDAAGSMGISYPPPSAAAPPSAYPLPRRGSEHTQGHGQGRVTPSRSQTHLSGNSNGGGYSAGPSQPSYPPSAMPAYPQRQQSRAQADYPSYPATAANASIAHLAAPGVSGHGYGTEQSAGSIQPGYTGDYGYTRSTSPLSYDHFDHDQRPQAGPPQRQLNGGGRVQQYQQYHQAQPQMVPRSARAPSPSPPPSSGLAYDQPDTDYASVDGHDPAPSYHTASPPRQDRQDRRHGPTYGYGGGQGGGQGRGHGYGDLHGW